MRPTIHREMKIGWYALAAVALLGGGVLWYLWSSVQKSRMQVVQERQDYRTRVGHFPYEYPENHDKKGQGELAKAKRGLENLRRNIEGFKRMVGLNKASPFILPPPAARDRGYYVKVVYDTIRDELNGMARLRSEVDFADDLGFHFPSNDPPPAEEAQHWSTMLQLVSKAAFLALQTNFDDDLDGLRHIAIGRLRNGHQVATGPGGRPPLLREYPFTLTVKGSLKDILWLLHQLSADHGTPSHQQYHRLLRQVAGKVKRTVEELGLAIEGMDIQVDDIHTGPLIVQGLNISSKNSQPIDHISQLTATFRLAGMDFLDNDERGHRKAVAAIAAANAKPDKPLKNLRPMNGVR